MSDAEEAGSMFPEPLAGWLAVHGALIDALVALRLAGEDEAVEVLLGWRELVSLRLSWEFWEGLVSEWDLSTDAVLRDWVPAVLVEHCELALWGRPLPGGRTLAAIAAR
jgi:hypothetical protein